MIHLELSVVTFAFLCVLRRHVEINVREMPPRRKTFAKVDPSPATTVILAFDSVGTVDVQANWLDDAESVAINQKGVVAAQFFKGTATVVVGHPVHIDALVFFRMIGNRPIPFQVDGTLMVLTASMVGVGGTPSAMIPLKLPAIGKIPSIGPAKLLVPEEEER